MTVCRTHNDCIEFYDFLKLTLRRVFGYCIPRPIPAPSPMPQRRIYISALKFPEVEVAPTSGNLSVETLVEVVSNSQSVSSRAI